ncbi:MAG: hypothetical protein Greene041619_568 [Candidatus Peregrinibacteria bacterium Greene0416_19]|nr:MAG: hypothetical protein Greene041619_568 [Candidatus Peregrinibacteria bacterium Greene0416_19]
MVQSRDVTVALGGAIVGILLASAAALPIGNALSADHVGEAVIRSPALVRKISAQRNKSVKSSDQKIRGYWEAEDDNLKEQVTMVGDSFTTNCDAATGIAAEVVAYISTILPVDGVEQTVAAANARAVSLMTDRMETLKERYCNGEAPAAAPAAAVRSVNNRCSQYSGGRYTQCKLLEKQGKKYP